MDAHKPKAPVSEALKIFRQLQPEMHLTSEQADAWKGATADARR